MRVVSVTSSPNTSNDETPSFKEVKAWFDKNMSTDAINFDDQRVYENVYHQATSRTPGVFQLTSQGAQRLFKNASSVNSRSES